MHATCSSGRRIDDGNTCTRSSPVHSRGASALWVGAQRPVQRFMSQPRRKSTGHRTQNWLDTRDLRRVAMIRHGTHLIEHGDRPWREQSPLRFCEAAAAIGVAEQRGTCQDSVCDRTNTSPTHAWFRQWQKQMSQNQDRDTLTHQHCNTKLPLHAKHR